MLNTTNPTIEHPQVANPNSANPLGGVYPTADEIIEDAKKLGLRLERGNYFNPVLKCGCAVGALSLVKQGYEIAPGQWVGIVQEMEAFYPRMFVRGLSDGFENISVKYNEIDYIRGHQLGMEVALKAGLSVEEPEGITI